MPTISKRVKFVIISAVLAAGFVGISLLNESFRFYGIGGLTLATILLFAWGLADGLRRNATLISLMLPTLFTLGVGLFWFLLPSTLVARLPIVIIYAVGIYAMATTSNIFMVSAYRSIALVRAAKGVGFVLSMFTSFLLFDAILSLKASVFVNVGLSFLASYPIFLQGLWTSKLSLGIHKSILIYSLFFSYAIAAIAGMLFFWPVTVVVGSLFLTVATYALLGTGQSRLEGRLFASTVREYSIISILVYLIIFFFATSWG